MPGRTRTSARSWKCSTMCRPMKPAPPVIKTRIGECKAAHQSSDQWIGKLKYPSIPCSFIRTVNFCENFWRLQALDCSVENIMSANVSLTPC